MLSVTVLRVDEFGQKELFELLAALEHRRVGQTRPEVRHVRARRHRHFVAHLQIFLGQQQLFFYRQIYFSAAHLAGGGVC